MFFSEELREMILETRNNSRANQKCRQKKNVNSSIIRWSNFEKKVSKKEEIIAEYSRNNERKYGNQKGFSGAEFYGFFVQIV